MNDLDKWYSYICINFGNIRSQLACFFFSVFSFGFAELLVDMISIVNGGYNPKSITMGQTLYRDSTPTQFGMSHINMSRVIYIYIYSYPHNIPSMFQLFP